MKLINIILFFFAGLCSAFGAAGDLKIDQKNASNNAWVGKIFATGNNSLFGTNGTGIPVLITATGAGGITISGSAIIVDQSFSPTWTGTHTFNNAITSASSIRAGVGASLGWTSRSFMTSTSDGLIVLLTAAGSDFGRLQFGGTGNSHPSLKRSGTTLQVRLADDSAFAGMSIGATSVSAGTATPAGGSTSARLVMGTTSGFGIYYGSGAPTVSAAQGSIYLRSDGSGATDRMYVNTDGGTTWTNVVTSL
jgi:hypothetical protein